MLVRTKPLIKRRFGLVVDTRPTILCVLKDELCPIHNKPFNIITKLEGSEPLNACIDCAIELLISLNDTVDEYNANGIVNSS